MPQLAVFTKCLLKNTLQYDFPFQTSYQYEFFSAFGGQKFALNLQQLKPQMDQLAMFGAVFQANEPDIFHNLETLPESLPFDLMDSGRKFIKIRLQLILTAYEQNRLKIPNTINGKLISRLINSDLVILQKAIESL